jgi:hypothetical protein
MRCIRSRRARRTVLLLVALVGGSLVSGCGASSSHVQAAPCATAAKAIGSARPMLTSAALLSGDIEVSSQRSTQPRCFPLAPDSTVHLLIGDQAEFVATSLVGTEPADSDVVAISVTPGPVVGGPGRPEGIPTTHSIVRALAVHSGEVRVRWTNCAGTAC